VAATHRVQGITEVKPRVLQRKKLEFLKRMNRSKYYLVMLLPCLIFFTVFHYLPMFGIIVSFKNFSLYKGVWASDWVGLSHYITFFQSKDFWVLLRNTFLLGFYSLLFGFPAPIILALMLNELRNMAYKRFVQTVSYIPHFISNVVIVSMLVMFLSPSGGLINQIIEAFGYNPVNFLVKAELFRSIFVVSGIWQQVGFGAIIYLAALSSIDPSLYEAAEIDGANRWNKIMNITLPGIAQTIVILFILNIGSVIVVGFEKVVLLYNPSTYSTADVLSTYVYRIGLLGGNFSYAAAIDMFTSVISLIFLLSANALSRRVSENSLW
jgi:putative aldouronate transport system permease protein